MPKNFFILIASLLFVLSGIVQISNGDIQLAVIFIGIGIVFLILSQKL